MGLRLILGPSRSGKTERVLQEIASQDAMQRIFYIVPEQMTLSAQKKLLDRVPAHGVMNTEVLSFNRFAHRVFEEVGMPAREVLDDMGKSLLLYRIADNLKDQLDYYGACVNKTGFIGQLKLMITEMLQYQIDPAAIRTMMEKGVFSGVVKAKWHDILLFWEAYNQEISEKRISSEQLLDYLSSRVSSSRTVADALFYFDEFTGFTPQQYAVLSQLLKVSPSVTVTLSISEDALKQTRAGVGSGEETVGLFKETGRTYCKLNELAESNGVEKKEILLSGTDSNRTLQVLREALFDYAVPVLPKDLQEQQQSVYISSFPTAEEEVSALMREILYLLRHEQYRLRDIAVIAPNLAPYEHVLGRALDTYRLDGFLDVKTPVTAHPFAQLILKATAACASGFASADVLAFLKTGLTPLQAEELDIFENECLAVGRNGCSAFCKALRTKPEWMGAGALADAIESLWLSQKGKNLTVAERLDGIEQFLKALDAKERMEAYAEQLEKEASEGNSRQSYVRLMRRAAEYAQLDDCFQNVSQSVRAFLGSMEMGIKEFSSLLEIGFGQYRLSVTPPSVDQLFIGDLKSSRPAEAKAVFILGFDEASFPGETDNPGLFNREERTSLRKNIEMAPDSLENVSLRYLQLYSILGKASERVYFSAYAGDSEGKANAENMLWQRIRLTVGACPWPKRNEYPCPEAALTEFGLAMSEKALEWLEENGYKENIRKLREAKASSNKKEKLDTKAVRELLEQYHQIFSVSQIERYVSCPFSYFADYMLRLKERALPEVRVLDDGILLHNILQLSGEMLTSLSSEPTEGEEEEIKTQVLSLCEESLNQEEYSVYQSSARYRFYWNRLQEAAADAVCMIRKQLSASRFVPEAFEWEFGEETPITIPLSDGSIMKFRGKIDRIDVLSEDGKNYIRIVDYKSGVKAFDEQKTLDGLSLQLPVYMEAALEAYQPKQAKGGERLPAGFFYYHMTAESQEDARMQGLVLADREVLAKMDSGYAEKETGFGIKFATKDGVPKNAYSKEATAEQFRDLGMFARQKIGEEMQHILNGEIQAEPVEYDKQKLACDYCPFQSVCGYDRKLCGVPPRKPEKAENFWEEIKKVNSEK